VKKTESKQPNSIDIDDVKLEKRKEMSFTFLALVRVTATTDSLITTRSNGLDSTLIYRKK
jgi:hydrogenase maturation factor